MERFALAAAVVLGFALTAALCSLFVPLRRCAGFSHQTNGLAPLQVKAHIANRFNIAVLGAVIHRQIPD